MEKGLKSVLITSSLESEGKTTTALNLAGAMIQTGKKVLLIDGDLRRPSLSRSFLSPENHKGLSELVSKLQQGSLDNGSLLDFSLADLVMLARLQERTGMLSVKDETHKVELDFIRGVPVSIAWINRPETKMLANTLIKKRLLSKKNAHRAFLHQKASRMKLGTILLSLGLVQKNELKRELLVHLVEAIIVACGIKKGMFEFREAPWETAMPSMSQEIDLSSLLDRLLSRENQYNYIKKSIDASIYRPEKSNLVVLPSGKVPLNPSELLSSTCIDFLITFLKTRYDLIIIDSPPVMAAADALTIAPRVDGTILVVHAGHTEKKIIKTVVERFESVELTLLGVLLNRVDLDRDGYYKYYRNYYIRSWKRHHGFREKFDFSGGHRDRV